MHLSSAPCRCISAQWLWDIDAPDQFCTGVFPTQLRQFESFAQFGLDTKTHFRTADYVLAVYSHRSYRFMILLSYSCSINGLRWCMQREAITTLRASPELWTQREAEVRQPICIWMSESSTPKGTYFGVLASLKWVREGASCCPRDVYVCVALAHATRHGRSVHVELCHCV